MELTWSVDDSGIYGKNHEGNVVTKATWMVDGDGTYVVNHTFVDESLRGQGMASKLMAKVAEHFREQGVKTAGSCSYAKAWYDKNRAEVQDILKD